jgi:hypothetical protein
MKRIRSLAVLFSVVAGLAPAAVTLSAQGTAVEAAAWVDRSGDAWGRELRRQPLVEQALRGHGFNPARLSTAQERALGETYQELFQDRDPRWERLNRTQATALVYMALVHSGRNRSVTRLPQRTACETVANRIWDLELAFAPPGRGQSRHLSRDEQQLLLAEAREIQRGSAVCGDRRLDEAAHELVELVSSRQPERERVTRQVNRMKSLVRLAVAGLASNR